MVRPLPLRRDVRERARAPRRLRVPPRYPVRPEARGRRLLRQGHGGVQEEVQGKRNLLYLYSLFILYFTVHLLYLFWEVVLTSGKGNSNLNGFYNFNIWSENYFRKDKRPASLAIEQLYHKNNLNILCNYLFTSIFSADHRQESNCNYIVDNTFPVESPFKSLSFV